MIVRIIENVALTVYFFSTLVPHVCLVFSVRPLPGLTLTPASFSSSTSSSSSSSSLSSSSSPLSLHYLPRSTGSRRNSRFKTGIILEQFIFYRLFLCRSNFCFNHALLFHLSVFDLMLNVEISNPSTLDLAHLHSSRPSTLCYPRLKKLLSYYFFKNRSNDDSDSMLSEM